MLWQKLPFFARMVYIMQHWQNEGVKQNTLGSLLQSSVTVNFTTKGFREL